MQRFSSFLCAAAMCVAALGASLSVQAFPLIIEDDPEAAAEAESLRRRSVNVLDTSGSNNPGLRTLQTLRELHDRRPGSTFNNHPRLGDGGGRMGVGNKGGPRGSQHEELGSVGQGSGFGDFGAGLFGSGLNAEAVARERVPDQISDDAAGVRQRPEAYVDPDSNDLGGTNSPQFGSHSVATDSGRSVEQRPGFMSVMLKFLREYRITVIAMALMLLLLAVGASVATRR